MNFSDFSNRVTKQPNMEMMYRAEALEQQGRNILHLEIGDNSTGFFNAELQKHLQDATCPPVSQGADMAYCASDGIYALRHQFAERYNAEKGTDFTGKNVSTGPANAFIYMYLSVLCNAGDGVLVPNPGYHVFYMVPKALSLHTVPYPLLESQNWIPDVDFIRTQLQSGTIKVMILCNPSNPLGVAVDGTYIQNIVTECEKYGVHVLMDETYKNLVYDDTDISIKHAPNVTYLYSLSKDAIAPALRIGSLTGDKAIIERVSDLNCLIYSCPSKILQHTALSYLNSGYDFTPDIAHVMKPRLQKVQDTLSNIDTIHFNTPNSAFYLFINVSRITSDSKQFCIDLLEQKNVCTCPGSAFGPMGENGFVRLNLATDEDTLNDGLERFADFVKTYV